MKELYLFANRIGPDGSKQISAIIKNKAKLTSLGLSNNKLNDTGCIELAQNGLKSKRFLVKLSFENNGMGNIALEAVSASLMDCTGIQEMYLYNNELDDEPIENFCGLLAKQQDIYALGLEMNRIGYKGIDLILKSLINAPKLEKLFLNNNEINV